MLKLNKQLMNKSTIKFLTDFGPLLVFFIVYYKGGGGLKLAIIYLILAPLISLVIIFFMEKKIPMVPLVSCVIIVLFGGLTIYLDNPIFIYIKPTIINLAFAIILISGKYLLIIFKLLDPIMPVEPNMFNVFIINQNNKLNKNNHITTVIKLSNLSKNPPCPGKNSLEFFKLHFLLNNDSITSPIKAESNNNKI